MTPVIRYLIPYLPFAVSGAFLVTVPVTAAGFLEGANDAVQYVSRAPRENEARRLSRSSTGSIRPLPRVLLQPRLLGAAAHLCSVSPSLLAAVIEAESKWDPKAVSPKGAIGLGQVLPSTGRMYGASRRDLFDPWTNLLVSACHLRRMLDEHGGDVRLALAAYNAGAGAVRRWKGVPPYRETREYVAGIMEGLEQ